MNGTDLRIAFKMDTGEDSSWEKDHYGRDLDGTSFRGYPRSIYGVWLEEKIGKPRYLRDRYFQVRREAPTSNFYNPGRREVFYEDYIEWLESFYLKLILRNDSI
jgi:hypothetical protein